MFTVGIVPPGVRSSTYRPPTASFWVRTGKIVATVSGDLRRVRGLGGMLSGIQLLPFSQFVTPAAPVQTRRMGDTSITTLPCRPAPPASVATITVEPARWPCTSPPAPA